VIRQLAGRALRRLLATAGLARAADLARERQTAARLVDAERARAGRDASARLAEFRTKVEASRRRVVAEHTQSNSLVGMLRYYLVRLRRTEAELAARVMGERRLKLEQLGIAIKVVRRRGVPPEAADRAAHLASVSGEYATAVARWRAGNVPADVRHVTLGHLDWSVPAGTSDPLGRRILDRGQLALDSLAVVRQFAVGGAMLDIGSGVGAASIPRVLLGDFEQAYAAEPGTDDYLCLVGNTLANGLEGRVLPHRVAIAGAGPAALRRCGRPDVEDAPVLTLEQWVTQLSLDSYAVRFVRVAMSDWNVDILDAAAPLLKRRHTVWQVEIDPTMLEGDPAPLSAFCSRVEAHFTHIKELGRYWTPQWRPSSEIGEVLGPRQGRRRPVNVLLFNLRRTLARRPKAVL
jgi:predicted RNA methylase